MNSLSIFTLAGTGSGGPELVLDMLVILGAASIISILLRRLHLAAIPGYLIIGTLVGSMPIPGMPHGLIQNPANVGQIQEVAIILLMFTIGLHLDLDAIRTGMSTILAIGAVSTVLVSLGLWPLAMLFGLSAPSALVVAMALSMASTAVILGILQNRKEVHMIQGRVCIGVSIMQDLMSIGMLAALPLLVAWAGVNAAATGDNPVPPSAWTDKVWSSVFAVFCIATMLAFAHYLLPKLLREASWGGNTEGLLVTSAGAGLAAAGLTTYLGFGPALGAFLAGFMLSSTPFRYQLTGQLGPMRDLFMAVFFTAVGAKLNLESAVQNWWVILIAVPAVMFIKFGITAVCVWAGGTTAAVALMSAALLAQAGEFSLVLLAEGERNRLISANVQGVMIPLVVISLILTPSFYEWAKQMVPRVIHIQPAAWFASSSLREQSKHTPQPKAKESAAAAKDGAAATADPSGAAAILDALGGPNEASSGNEQGNEPGSKHGQRHIIIAGFGVIGRNLAEHFAAAKFQFTVVELNSATVVRQNLLGRPTVFGDIANPDVLNSAGIDTAEAIVLTIPDDEATLRACRAIRNVRPDIFIAARASYLSRAIAAHELGADHVTIEEVVAAQDMAVKVMRELEKRFRKREPDVPHL